MADELLNDLMAKWMKAQESDAFRPKEPVMKTPSGNDFFLHKDSEQLQQLQEKDEMRQQRRAIGASVAGMKDMDGVYWEKLKEATYNNDGEVKCNLPGEKFDGAGPGEVAKDLANSPNPVQYPSREPDARRHVTPNWSCGVELVELHNMKKQLEQLESRLNAADALAKPDRSKKIKEQIDNLWKKIDDLSNFLSPDFVRDYMS